MTNTTPLTFHQTGQLFVTAFLKKHGRSICLKTVITLMATLVMTSCTKEGDDEDPSSFTNGIFVVNEGPFQTGTGTIDFIDLETNTIRLDVFATANDGQVLGNIAQSMHISGDTTYIVVNNANKVVLVNSRDFTYIGEIDNLPQARYIHVEGSTAYVTCWGDGFSGKIAIIDLETLTEKSAIEAAGPEQMLKLGSNLWVVISGGFGTSNKLGRIDLESNAYVEEFTLSDRPTALARGLGNNQFYILCSGYNDFAGTVTQGRLWQYEAGQVRALTTAANGASQLISNFSTTFFGEVAWLEGGELVIYRALSDDKTRMDLDMTSPRALAYFPFASRIAISDAVDFNSAGKLHLYDQDMEEVDVFDVGIIPAFCIYVL